MVLYKVLGLRFRPFRVPSRPYYKGDYKGSCMGA